MYKIRKIISIIILLLLFIIIIPNTYHPGKDNPGIVNNNQDNMEPALDTYLGTRARGNEPVAFQNVSLTANLTQHRANHFAWGDYNSDGYQDLLVGSKLLRNSGPPNWVFTDVTTAANLSGGGKGTWADYNNDGYLDFYTTNNKLWKNNGPPNYRFTDVTLSAGNLTDPYPTTASGWGDFDRDGDLDLYVVNGEAYINNNFVFYPDIFYENQGDGTFSDKTIVTGLDTSSNLAYGRSVNWGDYNNDGWLDIQVGNYRLRPNYLWRNNHDGTFTDMASEVGTAGVYDPEMYYDAQAESTYGDGTYGPTWGHTIGSAWGDFDNDGDLDLWDSNLVHKYVGPSSIQGMPYDIRGYVCDDSKIYFNNGGPHYNFTDARGGSGIPFKPIGGASVYQGDELWSGVAIGDYDNDGDLDVFVPQIYDLDYAYSFLFRNNNNGTFTEVALQLDLRVYNTYGATWCDYNNDGFLDLAADGKSPFIGEAKGSYETHLFKNLGNSNNWLKVRLIGKNSNSLGMGAKVIATTGELKQIRQVEGGMGSHSQQNQITLHFGLGKANIVDTLEVQWPNGKAQILNNVQVNQQINITENLLGPEITAISVSKTDVIEDETITFGGSATDPDGSITKYEWDFNGDNIFDWSDTSSPQTTFKYNKSDEYYAKLRVWDDSGVLYSDMASDFITVTNTPPVAAAGSDRLVWEDEIILFDASGSSDTPSDLVNLYYNWSFGDNNYSGWQASPNIQHSYSLRGNYDVTLFVRDNDNESSTDSVRIVVQNKPPSCVIQAQKSVAEDSSITFYATGNDTPSDMQYLVYHWDFGDGNQSDWSGENFISHTYSNNGTYVVKCKIRDDDGVQDENFTEVQIIVFNQKPECFVEEDKTGYEDHKVYLNGSGNDTISDFSTLTFLWDFGDGTTSSLLEAGKQNVTHIYTKQGLYHARLIVMDDDGAVCKRSIKINVKNVKPICWAMDDVSAAEDQIIEFTGSAEDTKSDQDLLEYSWYFGISGQPATAWNASPEFIFSYLGEGMYEAVLTVRDDDGDIANDTVNIRILNVEPKAKFLMSAKEVNEDQVVEFNALQSTDSDSDLETLVYTWDFGDKSPKSTGSITYHQFYDAGEYRVSLLVTDDNSDTDSSKLTIKVKNVAPTAVISVSTDTIYTNTEVIFNGAESSDTASDLINLSFYWDFGGGDRYSGNTVAHSFVAPGKYEIKLQVTDDDGANSEVKTTVTVIEFTGENAGTESDVEDSTLMLAAGIVVVLIAILLIFSILFLHKPKITEEGEGEHIEIVTSETKFIPPRSKPTPSKGINKKIQPKNKELDKPSKDIDTIPSDEFTKASKLRSESQDILESNSIPPKLPPKSEMIDQETDEAENHELEKELQENQELESMDQTGEIEEETETHQIEGDEKSVEHLDYIDDD